MKMAFDLNARVSRNPNLDLWWSDVSTDGASIAIFD